MKDNIPLQQTVNFIKHYLGEVDGGRDKSVVCRVPIVSWKLPQEHFVKINFDAGFCQQNNKSCSEIIIRDDSEGLKRNVETYLAGAIPSFAHKAVEVDRQQLGS
ncbi:hypothetical protein Gohar_026914 [Gossypium harknessii]|uniref:Uncharacterized protein n=1 Tax=Gossypium harknessii TaxID=34285 RepID=A0A7J9HVU8_9ROSI|nr:hypothetical protein [Gossypium harknessii]